MKRIRTLPQLSILLFWLVLPSFVAGAPRYSRLRLHELAATAEVIVSGEVIAVGGGNFDFAVDQILLGEDVPARLHVKQFVNWGCHQRWANYQRGERMLLFLRKDADRWPGHFIVGAGDEGEMQLVGESAVMEYAQGLSVRGFPVQSRDWMGGTITGCELPFQELRAALLGFREHFRWKMDGYRMKFWSRDELELVEEFRESSQVARHLVDSARSSRQWIGRQPPLDVVLERSGVGAMVASDSPSEGPFLVAPGRGLSRAEFRLANPRARASLALIGDVDGDGIGDLAFGEPGDSRLGNRHGVLWILFLDEHGNVRGRTEIGEGLAGFPARMNEFAGLGMSVAGLGDLDRDGIPDLVLGAPHWNGDSDSRGAAWVLFLKRDGSVKSARELGAEDALQAAGVGAHYGLGNSFANLGDLDGDGTLELAIGQAPSFGFEAHRGRSILIASLDENAHVLRLREIESKRDGFGDDSTRLGDCLSSVGDLDGDGIGELVIADPGADDGGNTRGALWIVFLDEGLKLRRKQKISDWSGGFDGLLRDGAGFGKALAGPGDLDQDGIPDLLVGSTKRVWTLFLNADGTVRESAEATLVDKPSGVQMSFGSAIACAPFAVSGTQLELLVLGGSKPQAPALWWLELGLDGKLRFREPLQAQGK